MQLHTRSERTVMRRLTALATAVLVGIVAVPFSSHAQTSPFQAIVPCYVPPSPATDTWPVAGEDSLGPTAGMPVTFASAALLSNDHGSAIAVSSIDRVSYGGGQISGTDPFTYTPAVGFIGTDSFAYEISDGSAQTAIGVISVAVTADVSAPTVSIDAPANGAVVSSNVPLTATASDNVGVAGVTFLDGGAPIGAEVLTAPFQATWQTGLVSDGAHTLIAIARDAAGNTATSAPVSVTVRNLASVPAIIGMTQASAQAAIAAAGLTVGTVSSANSAAPAGQVIGQSPGVGASVAPNSAVSFTVSIGPALVTVPSVVGSLQPAAQATITGAGLTVGAVTTANSATVPAGAVISQTPIAGATVAPSSAVALVVSSGPAATAVPTVEKIVFSDGLGKRTTAAFSTAAGGDLLVAFAASDGPAAPNGQTLTIAGAGLSWTRRARANTQFGVAEIWTAPAPVALTSATVSSTQSTAGLHQSLTVIAFTGVAGVGAANATSGIGAPSVGITTMAAGSAVYAVGNDWDRAVARTLPAGQTKVHEFVDTAVGDTFWVQALSATSGAAGSVVTLNATAPTADQYNLAIVELTPGAAPVAVSVPNVVGLAQAAAQNAIAAAGLSLGAVTTAASASVPAGQVISQTPASGTSVASGSAVALVISSGAPLSGPTVDANVFSNGTGTRTTPAFSAAAGDVLVAFAASDGPTTGTNTQTLTISGAGLVWTRIARAATSRGVSEIWTATAPAALSNATVNSAQSVTLVNGAAVNQLLNVVAFSNATGIGASNIAAAASGAPAVSLVAQAAGSVVYAVGNDFDQAIARTVPAGQTKVREFLAPTGDTFWVQAVNAATAAAGAAVTINDTAPTADQWNYAIVEVKR